MHILLVVLGDWIATSFTTSCTAVVCIDYWHKWALFDVPLNTLYHGHNLPCHRIALVLKTRRPASVEAMTSRLPRCEAKCVQRRCFQCGSVHLRSDIKGTDLSLPIYWYHSKGNWLRYNFAADSFYIGLMLIFALDKLNIRHICTSGLVDLLT